MNKSFSNFFVLTPKHVSLHITRSGQDDDKTTRETKNEKKDNKKKKKKHY